MEVQDFLFFLIIYLFFLNMSDEATVYLHYRELLLFLFTLGYFLEPVILDIPPFSFQYLHKDVVISCVVQAVHKIKTIL